MASKGQIETEKRKQKLVNKYQKTRDELRLVVKNKSLDISERTQASYNLSRLPRRSSSSRLINRCWKTGCPRSVFRLFGLNRISLRDFANAGLIPGLRRASW